MTTKAVRRADALEAVIYYANDLAERHTAGDDIDAFLRGIRPFFDDRMDVNWHGTGPNAEMVVLGAIDAALEAK